MKESLIREIYFGSFDPKHRTARDTAGKNEAFKEILSMSESLQREMPDHLKVRFQRFSDACMSLLSEQSAEDFHEGYRLGVRLMIDALMDNNDMS